MLRDAGRRNFDVVMAWPLTARTPAADAARLQSNRQLVAADDGSVSLRWKDYSPSQLSLT